uniref:Uncharacterized protein n=1 Tax=Noccaea caerulescens TaxID=107243 RepID=A0A1J3FXX4_NOCCA
MLFAKESKVECLARQDCNREASLSLSSLYVFLLFWISHIFFTLFVRERSSSREDLVAAIRSEIPRISSNLLFIHRHDFHAENKVVYQIPNLRH